VEDVAVADGVVRTFEVHLSGVFGALLAAMSDKIVVGDGFGPDKALSKSLWMTRASCGVLVPRVIGQARPPVGRRSEAVRKVIGR
jgi:hypothetical protein